MEKFQEYLELDNRSLKEILSYVKEEPVFLDKNVRLFSKEEIVHYKSELKIDIDNIIPLFDISDNEVIAYEILKNEFVIVDISDDFVRQLDSVQKYIEMLKN